MSDPLNFAIQHCLSLVSCSRVPRSLFFLVCLLFTGITTHGQMREIYRDSDEETAVTKICFYTPTEGYVAFNRWIGYTTDGGKTFTKKMITLSNVDFGGYEVNITFGFGVQGIKAFNKNQLVVYGNYGLVPAILYSSNGGNNFKLVFHSQYRADEIRTGITDMLFPENNEIGYAIDADRILKTMDKGASWFVAAEYHNAYFSNLTGSNNTHVFANNKSATSPKLVKTTDGHTFQLVPLPEEIQITDAFFLTDSKGWILSREYGGNRLYYTSNGGASWRQKNDPSAGTLQYFKVKFLNDNIGYALGESFTMGKTTDGGSTWERVQRDKNFTYLGYTHTDLQLMGEQQLWAGGHYGLLEASNNAGGPTIPAAAFKVDKSQLLQTHEVQLINLGKPAYSYTWYKNGTVISTAFHTSYQHEVSKLRDTIKLVVTNGGVTNTVEQYIDFPAPVILSAFTPATAGMYDTVTITGTDLSNITAVSFGGVPALSFKQVSGTTLQAVVGNGASGDITVIINDRYGLLPGFSFMPPPAITSYSPDRGRPGDVITITGNNFNGVKDVSFGGMPAASFTVVSPTLITAVLGTGNTGNIQVTAAGGKATSTGFQVIPEVKSYFPSSGTYGTRLTIKGSGFTGTHAVRIGEVPVLSFTVHSSELITAIVGKGATGEVKIGNGNFNSYLPGFTYYNAPVINYVKLRNTPVGDSVLIGGVYFNTDPAANTVYFGAVKGTVTASTGTKLTVTVPVGATFSPVSVTSNHLTAYSDYMFSAAFSGGGTINQQSLTGSTSFLEGTALQNPRQTVLADLDGDGKAEMITTGQHGFLVAYNTSIPGQPSFGKNFSYKLGVNGADKIIAHDLDGDGKLDLIVNNSDKQMISIFRNTTAGNNISFAAQIDVAGALLGIGDLNNDGKPDIVVFKGTEFNNELILLKSFSEPAMLVFEAVEKILLPDIKRINGGMVQDVISSGKPDLIFYDTEGNTIGILRNISTIDKFIFDNLRKVSTSSPVSVAVGNLDEGGLADMVVANAEAKTITVFKNVSNGQDYFAPTQTLRLGDVSHVALSDIDGDGKPDIVAASGNYQGATVFKNISILDENNMGIIKIGAAVKFNGVGPFSGITPGDIDNDGKPDLVAPNASRHAVSILRNTVTAQPYIISFSPTICETGTTVTLKGALFTGTTAVSFGGVPATSFTVEGDSTITAVVGAGASGDVKVTNAYGSTALDGFSFGLPPVITAISPLSGPVGTTVTIKGKRFSPVATENIVSFGGVQAKVNAATANSLTVTVPVGSQYKPLTVTTHQLTTSSSDIFVTTYPNRDKKLTAGAFADKKEIPGSNSGDIADIDGDGKLDLITPLANELGVYRNTSVPGKVTFAEVIKIPVNAASGPALGDLNGDGKPDLVVLEVSNSSISILKNISSQGNIAFTLQATYTAIRRSDVPSRILIMDLDGDGKPDLITGNHRSPYLVLFRNNSTAGKISFEEGVFLNNPPDILSITCGDYNQDGKPDLALSQETMPVPIILQNNSTPGQLSFNTLAPAVTPESLWGPIATGDLDGDGKPDIVKGTHSSLSLFRNTSMADSIIFSAPKEPTHSNPSIDAVLGDLNGDGKPDIFTIDQVEAKAHLFLNNSSPGTISVQHDIQCPIPYPSKMGNIADMDGDGKPDLISYAEKYPTVIHRNMTGEFKAVSVCSETDTSFTTSVKGNKYQWQKYTGSVFEDLSDDQFITGTASAKLMFGKVPIQFNGILYRCMVDNVPSDSISLEVIPVTSPYLTVSADADNICPSSPVNFTASIQDGGTLLSYQWFIDDQPVGTNSPTYSIDTATQSHRIKLLVTSNLACSNPGTGSVMLNVLESPPPSVNITSSATVICDGYTVTFTAEPQNINSSYSFRWEVNGAEVANNNVSTFTRAFNPDDKIRVKMYTAASACWPAGMHTSEYITLQQGTTATIQATITAPASVCYEGYYELTFNSNNAPEGASVTLWESETNNPGTFSMVGTKQWLGAPMQFGLIVPRGASTRKHYFTVRPSEGNTCMLEGRSETVTISMEGAVPPIIALQSNKLVITNPNNSQGYSWQVEQPNGEYGYVVPAANGTSYAPGAPGYYRVKSVQGSCVSYSPPIAFVITGINSPDPNIPKIQTYPNPVRDVLTLEGLRISDKWETLDITGMDGSLQRTINIKGKTKVTIATGHLPQGMYMGVLRRNNAAPALIRFVKQ
ncbi:FG-GAP-like repeat-containing protein [Chitinophaga defluvii]|uniref:FG-GAP-like repeat-containing protein n=1 Tax=Chitinophaga defluvii TaxID=3163343 RepID=A0ABV2TAM9_9BACT